VNKNYMNNVSFISLFANPLMQVQLDLDLGKLTELVFQIWRKKCNDKI